MADRPFTLFFGGGEVPGWRELLLEGGVNGMALTYYNLRRRMPKKKPWAIEDHVPEGPLVLLESGAYTANKDPGQFDREGWIAYDEEYRSFVDKNLDRIDLVTEFDSLILGPDYIHQMRQDFWSQIPDEKFMPVWHAQFGLEELERLAGEYDHVAVPHEALKSSLRISAKINNLTQRFGTRFHGSAITSSDALMNTRFASAGSTSWLSPVQYGDTIVWDGVRLRRYPKKYKEQARKRHRTLFTRAGYDAEKIADGDPTEVAKFSIWSWLKLEEAVGKRRRDRPFDVIEGDAEDGSSYQTDDEQDPDIAHDEVKAVARPQVVRQRIPVARTERRMLPVFGFEDVEVATGEVDDDGNAVMAQMPLAQPQRKSQRRCDSCFVSGTCPAFEPGNECAYDLPLEIRNRQQLHALLQGVIEMQAQRVAFARFAEELEGGYPDPNLSNEMDRLFKLTESMKEIEDNRDVFEMSVKAKAGAGVLSRIFGSNGQQQPAALPEGGYDRAETERILGQIVDAEVVDPVTGPPRD